MHFFHIGNVPAKHKSIVRFAGKMTSLTIQSLPVVQGNDELVEVLCEAAYGTDFSRFWQMYDNMAQGRNK